MDAVRGCLLLDFYGQLLTERTRLVLEYHYAEDMSLAEIASEANVSRQCVHDTIRRGTASLVEYEEKLKLVECFVHQKDTINEAIDHLNRDDVDTAKSILTQLVSEL
ncbi:MAG TPA: sigma factor-like helix-turn-helix DNA-binding protein [Bacillota bacterium]|nr:sigma factor-like helix-turn-helix DNA-binding protein [Bacillota bacterium]